MITFKSRNECFEVKEYSFNSVDELKERWNKYNNVPDNADIVWEINIDGTLIPVECEDFWFEDLLTYLGIEIWYW